MAYSPYIAPLSQPKKKKIFALKHLSDPIYQIKKNIFSLILGGGGVVSSKREISLIFLYFFIEPFPNVHYIRGYLGRDFGCVPAVGDEGSLE